MAILSQLLLDHGSLIYMVLVTVRRYVDDRDRERNSGQRKDLKITGNLVKNPL